MFGTARNRKSGFPASGAKFDILGIGREPDRHRLVQFAIHRRLSAGRTSREIQPFRLRAEFRGHHRPRSSIRS